MIACGVRSGGMPMRYLLAFAAASALAATPAEADIV
jgi:hypothetical protein